MVRFFSSFMYILIGFEIDSSIKEYLDQKTCIKPSFFSEIKERKYINYV